MEKHLLMIAPVFFDYYKEIRREMENMGIHVDFLCDSPSNSSLSKALGRVNKKLIFRSTQLFYTERLLPLVRSAEYDYVFVVAGMTFAFSPGMVKEIRQIQKNARFILYQWDSEKNLPYSTGIHPYFDVVYSFDLNDCKHRSLYTFLPLFYTSAYGELGKYADSQFVYDCSYVGTAHPQKLRDINMMSAELKEKMPKQFIFHYMPSKLKFLYHKLLAPEFKNAKLEDFQYEKLSNEEVISVVRDSRCILDAPQAGQTGLTIRTIECLGARKKLITTNRDVVNYDFYRPENILVFEGEIDFSSGFFSAPYVDIPKALYDSYSLCNWIKKMLE